MKLQITEHTITKASKEQLEEALARCKPGSKKYEAIKLELSNRKPDGSRMTLEDWL